MIIASGRGGRVWDMSGNEYVDYLLGSAPCWSARASGGRRRREEQVRKGTTFFTNN